MHLLTHYIFQTCDKIIYFQAPSPPPPLKNPAYATVFNKALFVLFNVFFVGFQRHLPSPLIITYI